MVSYRPKLGDIVLVNFSPSIGKEKQGARPALVVSNDLLMKTSSFAWVVPITNGAWQYPLHLALDGQTTTQGTIHVEQLKSFDYRDRNFRFLEKCPNEIVIKVLNMIQGITNN